MPSPRKQENAYADFEPESSWPRNRRREIWFLPRLLFVKNDCSASSRFQLRNRSRRISVLTPTKADSVPVLAMLSATQT